MRHVLLRCLGFAAACWIAVPAFGALYYEAETSVVSNGQSVMATRAEAWIDGDNARVEFRESTNPMAPAGTYAVTQDGGQTIYLVNPKEETYSIWDIDALLQSAGQIMDSMGGVLKIEIGDPQVEKLVDEEGEAMFGLSTRHLQFRTRYDMTVRVMGIKNRQEVDRVQDFWVTEDIPDPAMAVWLRSRSAKTGNEGLDKLISAELDKVTGVALKQVEVSTNTNKKGKQTVTTTTFEVEELKRGVGDPEGGYGVPEGYRKTEMAMSPANDNEGDGEKSRNPLKGLFGGGR